MDRLDKECTVSLHQTRGEEATDKIEMRDAAVFPLYASAGLFGLYLFFKVFGDEGGVGIVCHFVFCPFQYVPKEYVNLLLSMFFIMLGVSALTRALR